jgi:hypothetical protein
MISSTLKLSIAVTLFCCLPAQAHHSFAAEYDRNVTVTLEGAISKLG